MFAILSRYKYTLITFVLLCFVGFIIYTIFLLYMYETGRKKEYFYGPYVIGGTKQHRYLFKEVEPYTTKDNKALSNKTIVSSHIIDIERKRHFIYALRERELQRIHYKCNKYDDNIISNHGYTQVELQYWFIDGKKEKTYGPFEKDEYKNFLVENNYPEKSLTTKYSKYYGQKPFEEIFDGSKCWINNVDKNNLF